MEFLTEDLLPGKHILNQHNSRYMAVFILR
jgi:hypothetical protein